MQNVKVASKLNSQRDKQPVHLLVCQVSNQSVGELVK
jgi:hypothetical protein